MCRTGWLGAAPTPSPVAHAAHTAPPGLPPGPGPPKSQSADQVTLVESKEDGKFPGDQFWPCWVTYVPVRHVLSCSVRSQASRLHQQAPQRSGPGLPFSPGVPLTYPGVQDITQASPALTYTTCIFAALSNWSGRRFGDHLVTIYIISSTCVPPPLFCKRYDRSNMTFSFHKQSQWWTKISWGVSSQSD